MYKKTPNKNVLSTSAEIKKKYIYINQRAKKLTEIVKRELGHIKKQYDLKA